MATPCLLRKRPTFMVSMNTRPEWVDRQDLRQIVADSKTVSQVLIQLGLVPKGGNYAVLKKWLRHLGITTEHFTQKGKRWVGKGDVLVKNSSSSAERVKRLILSEHHVPYECASCGLTTWLDVPITLELDHIDGDHRNNEISNLRFLCPNCHSLTPTFRGRNKRSPGDYMKSRDVQNCVDCGKVVMGSTRCSPCHHKDREAIDWPPDQELADMIARSNTIASLASVLGVNSNTLRDRCKVRGINCKAGDAASE